MIIFAIIGLITVVVIIVHIVNSYQSNMDSSHDSRQSYSSASSPPPVRPVSPSKKMPDFYKIHSLWRIHAQKLFDYIETMRSVNYISDDIVFESLTAFYIISLTFSNKRLDASSFLSDFYMNEVFEDPMFREYKTEFWSRVSLYQKAISTKSFRCECLPALPESEKKSLDPLTAIMIVYGDLLWNPACAQDYENAPPRAMNSYEYSLFYYDFFEGLHEILLNFAESWDNYTKSLSQ